MIRHADISTIKSRVSNYGFTLIEVIVVILVITVLAGLMYPLVRGVMEKARAAKCQAHMRQLAVGCIVFSSDNGGGLPPLYTWQELFPEIAESRDKIATGAGVVAWPDLIRQHVGNDDAFSCPSLKTNATIGYGDVVPPPEWRLVAVLEGLTGVLMLGWSSALVFAVVTRLFDSQISKGE